MDDTAACAAALVLAYAGESSLRTATSYLVKLAGDLEQAAIAAGAPHTGLAAIRRMVSDADDTRKVDAVKMLGKTAMALEKAAADAAAAARFPRDTSERGSQERAAVSGVDQEEAAMAMDTVVCTAHRLARACQDYVCVADAIPLVRRASAEADERARHAAAEAERERRAALEAERARRAAAEDERTRQEQRVKDAATTQDCTSHTRWWSCLGRSKVARRPPDIEDPGIKAPLIKKANPPTPSPSATGNIELGSHGQGDDKRSGMMGYGLFGSIGLIPYLAPEKVAKKVESLSDWKMTLHIGVCLWWTLVALGAPCSAYAQSTCERAYALISSRLGILGMNIVVILFMYCVLDIDNLVALFCLLSIAIFSHAVFLIMAWRRGHF